MQAYSIVFVCARLLAVYVLLCDRVKLIELDSNWVRFVSVFIIDVLSARNANMLGSD